MPKRTNDFQTAIALIYEQLAQNLSNVTITESKMLRDAQTGQEREVDVVIEAELLGEPITIAIECRGRLRNDGIEWVDCLIGKYKDLPVTMVFAISRSGFSETARIKAEMNKIALRTLTSAASDDWVATVQRLSLLGPVLLLTAAPSDDYGIVFDIDEHADFPWDGSPFTDLVILDANGDRLGTFPDLCNELWNVFASQIVRDRTVLPQPPPGTRPIYCFRLPPGTHALGSDGLRYPILEFRRALDHRTARADIVLHPGTLGPNQVAMGSVTSTDWQFNFATVQREGEEPVVGVQMKSTSREVLPGVSIYMEVRASPEPPGTGTEKQPQPPSG